MKLDEVKLINEYLESFKQEKSRDKAIQMMAEKREGTDKLDLILRIMTLGQKIDELLAKATKDYLDSFEEIELLQDYGVRCESPLTKEGHETTGG